MKDVFDEDLMRELGLDPDEIEAVKKPEAAVKPAVKPPAPQPKAPAKAAPPQPAASQPKTQAAAPASTAPQPAPAPAPSVASDGERMMQNLSVHVAAVLAKKTLALKDVIEMRPGEIVDFKKAPQEPIDLVVNGKLVAKAELVLVDGKVGARILKLVR